MADLTRAELGNLLDEYAALRTRHSSRGPSGTYRSFGPSREQRERAAEIHQRILDAFEPAALDHQEDWTPPQEMVDDLVDAWHRRPNELLDDHFREVLRSWRTRGLLG